MLGRGGGSPPMLLSLFLTLLAAPREWHIDDAWGRDVVQFRSTAPIEDVTGTTNAVTGRVKFDPENLAAGAEGRIAVDGTSLKTGLGLRDEHLRGTLASKEIVFTLEKLESPPRKLEPGKPADLKAIGKFELHGTSRMVTVPVRVTLVSPSPELEKFRPGNLLRIQSDFDVKLDDYGIDRKGPILKMQVGETAHVTLSILASDASDEQLAKYRASAKKWLGKDARVADEAPPATPR